MALTSIIDGGQLRAMASLAYRRPAGDFAEVGVFNGGSAAVLYGIALPQGRQLHLFDTFTGTPVATAGLDHHQVDGEFAVPGAEARIRRELPSAHLYVGVYPETHPKHLGPLAFIHCDCDQYLSYRAVIDRMWPLLVPGGVLLFDDYPYLAGAKRAVEETWPAKTLRRCLQRFYVEKGA